MPRSSRQRRLRFQSLENRNLLAGLVHVEYDSSAGHMSVVGDEFDNSVRIEFNNAGDGLTSIVIADDDGSTSIVSEDGELLDFLAFDVDPEVVDVWVDMGRGDDSIILENAVGGTVRMGDEVEVNGNDGDDFLAVAGAPGAKLTVGKLTVDGGFGEDFLLLFDLIVDANMTVEAGAGDDLVFLDSSSVGTLQIDTDGGVDVLDLLEVDVAGNVSIDTGTGDNSTDGDTIEITDSTFGGDLNISTGAGPDMVTIDPTSINRNLTINTNGGDDAIVLDEVTVERNTTINTGTGMDGLTILSSMLSRFEADLGDGNDVLTMTSTTVTARSTVSTAGGDDQVLLNNNTFQWRLVIDMGVGDLAMDRFEAFNNSFTGGSVTGYTENLVAMGGNTGTLELTQMLRRGRGSAPRRRAR